MAKLKNTVIINELKSIASRHGGILMPEEVVKAARPQSSPLHSHFTWDDTEAAEKCRLQEARQLVNICVEYIGTENNGRETKVFVSLRDDRSEGGYRPLVSVLSDGDLRDSLLTDALEEMNYFRSKYAGLKELVVVFTAMNVVQSKLKKKK